MSHGVTNNSTTVVQPPSPSTNNSSQLLSNSTSPRSVFSNASKNMGILNSGGGSEARDDATLSIGLLLNKVSDDLSSEAKHQKPDVASTAIQIEQDIQKISDDIEERSDGSNQPDVSLVAAKVEEGIQEIANNLSAGGQDIKQLSKESRLVEVSSVVTKIEQDIQKINANLETDSAGGLGESKNAEIASIISKIEQDIQEISGNLDMNSDGQSGDTLADDYFILSLISSLLGVLEELTSNSSGVSNPSSYYTVGSPVYSQELVDQFNLLLEFLGLFGEALQDKGDTRVEDIISLFDQQLEEQRYRARQSRSMITQTEYLNRKR
ncbi:MAG TPA: hypothetical protein EYG68_05150 [Leucothrix mucor]|nr:hypothetical protein [Leucothrix mucor]